MKTLRKIILAIFVMGSFSCGKYLDIKPDEKLAVPSDKLEYLQLLLDNTSVMNLSSLGASDIGTDDMNIPDVQWNTLYQRQVTSANAYIWDKNIFNDIERNDWSISYKVVFNANLVLESLTKIDDGSSQTSRAQIKGAALFFRSYAFYHLLQEFALGYEPSTASNILGIPLRLTSDINEKITRASLQECYDLILKDLSLAKDLLPETVSHKTSPSKAAALALLAKTHLVMKNYENALAYAKMCLTMNSEIIDYKTLNASASFPFSVFNKEVIFHSVMNTYTAFTVTYGKVSQDLFDLYPSNDLRKVLFYINGGLDKITFKGNYTGASTRFNGITTAELALIEAECYARQNDLSNAMNSLNKLCEKRFANTFNKYSASNVKDAVDIILLERRKELAFRNIRWSDLKRLNNDPRYGKTITRNVNGSLHTLNPGDSRYALPIPIAVINSSGIEQN